ncbi:MAG TPA: DUF4118 domain-containing protein [Thermoanaerobaculia bacterium]|nr:DUF4118 domain-containing protein [Thermoanaerobaculia bacterium]
MGRRRPLRLLLAVVVVAAVTAAGAALQLNQPTMGFLYLLVVLGSSIWGGLLVSMVASVQATACYNFFFFPPLYTLNVEEPENWVALGTFLVTSIAVSRLVVAARVQAERAEQRRREVEALSRERERFLEQQAHLQALRESDELKTSLLRAVSHDLTTPLTAISLHTQALQREAAGSGPLAETASSIADETARLWRRIDNLLAMARLEAGHFTPRAEPTPPADLFRAVRENLPLVFNRRPVAVRVEADCPDAQVDPSLALEILVNLVENAHRAAPAQTAIELEARRGAGEAGRIWLEVLDRGPGPDAEVIPGEPGRAAAASGDGSARRGLGLEIARGLAKASHGSLSLVNRPEGGAVARLDLPAALIVAGEEES